MLRNWLRRLSTLMLAGLMGGAGIGCQNCRVHWRPRNCRPVPAPAPTPAPCPRYAEPGSCGPAPVGVPIPPPDGFGDPVAPQSLPPLVPPPSSTRGAAPRTPPPARHGLEPDKSEPIPSLEPGTARKKDDRPLKERLATWVSSTRTAVAGKPKAVEPTPAKRTATPGKAPLARNARSEVRTPTPVQPVRLGEPTEVYEFSETAGAEEPVRVAPARNADLTSKVVPTRGVADAKSFRIAQAALCSEINGFNRFTTMDPRQLQAGQPILLYTALTGYRSEQQGEARHTRTESTLEILSGGQVVAQVSLGEANDVSVVPREDYFVSHRTRIPGGLAPGNYVLRLSVRDRLANQSARCELPIRLTADRSLPDEKDGSGKSASVHASTR